MALLGSVSGGLLSRGLPASAAMRGRCSREVRSSGARAESLPCCKGSGGALWARVARPKSSHPTFLCGFYNSKAYEDVLPTGSWAALSLVDLFRRLALAACKTLEEAKKQGPRAKR